MLGVANANSEEKNNYLACGPDLPRRAPRASHPAGPTPTPTVSFRRSARRFGTGRGFRAEMGGAAVPLFLECQEKKPTLSAKS